MTDNTPLNAGSGGDTTRTIDRLGLGVKTQVAQIDIGGANGNAEALLTGGQKTSAQSISIVRASDSLAEPGGAAITGASMPSGGLGITGWLSAIWKALGGTLSTQAANPATIFAIQFTPGLSASAPAAQAVVNGAVVTALKTNTATIFIGGSNAVTDQIGGAPGYPLVAGQSISYAVTNLSAIWMIADNVSDAVAITGN